MATLTKPYTFVANTKGKSGEVNANFDAIVAFVNTNMMQKDGTTAFTGLPTLPSAPTDDLHPASKGYVDAAVPKVAGGVYTGVLTGTSEFTVTHNLGGITSGVAVPNVATGLGVGGFTAAVSGGNSSQITFQVYGATGALVANGTTVRFNWVAYDS